MKKYLFAIGFSFLAFAAWSQSDLLTNFNRDRLQRQKTGMMVLGGWAVGNLALGAALGSARSGEDKYFHLMNAGWGAVNLGIAALGYWGAVNTDPASFDLYQSVQEQHKLQKVLLFNAGLDVGYMLGGVYLMERSKNTEKNPERLKGFGKSIILQGAFLFTFDLVNHFVHAAHDSDLQPLLSSLYFSGDQIGLVLQF